LVYEFNKKYSSWQTFVFATFNSRFEEILSVLDSVVFQKMDMRLIQLLERHATVNQSSTISLSHQLIAEEMATSREVVSRLLKKLEQEGYLKLSRGQITLL
ncbi:MAG: helix-turn-helix domain-containing protein, partial [Bacteroidota bacterium]